MSPLARAHLHVHGRVQGVSFRYYARQRAVSLGLVGWVRSCPDGTVEVVIEGKEGAVQQFIDWSRRGPSLARVERVEVRREDADGLLTQFRISH